MAFSSLRAVLAFARLGKARKGADLTLVADRIRKVPRRQDGALMKLAPPTAASLRALLLTPALTCRRSMASTAAIEVERKFAASDPSALRQRVEANGGQVLGEKAFNDQYWDNAQCTLTRRDTWLRRRQDQWELKVPIVGSRRSGGETTSFREIEGEPGHARTPSMRR